MGQSPIGNKFTEENIGVNLPHIGFGTDFLDMTPKAQVTKGKMDKLDFIKILASMRQSSNPSTAKKMERKAECGDTRL
jgi:hypothetical protein